MRVKVVVGFVDKDWRTRLKGQSLELDEAYATTLVERGYVELEDVRKASKAKSNKKRRVNK